MLKVNSCQHLTNKRLRLTGNVVSRPHTVGNEKGGPLELFKIGPPVFFLLFVEYLTFSIHGFAHEVTRTPPIQVALSQP